MDYYLCILLLFVAVVLGYALMGGCECTSTLQIAVSIVIIYLILSTLINYYNSTYTFSNEVSSNEVSSNVATVDTSDDNKDLDEEESNDDDSIKYIKSDKVNETIDTDEYVKVKSLVMPLMGEFDHIDPKTLIDKVKGIYANSKATYPYKPDNHQTKTIGMDKRNGRDGEVEKSKDREGGIAVGYNDDYLAIAGTYYPQLTKDQLNYEDCSNFNWKDNRSCIQPPDGKNLRALAMENNGLKSDYISKSILGDAVNNIDDLKLVLKEDFSVPAGVLDTVCKQRIAHNNYVKHNGVYPAGNESDRTRDQCVNCIDTTDNICLPYKC